MADRYWRGGTGTWDATTTTNWSTFSGGPGGASAPTATDNVFFDVNSNTGTGAFTVTVSTSRGVAKCRDITISELDGAMTLVLGLSNLTVYGSWTNPATRFAATTTLSTTGSTIIDRGSIIFAATTTGHTVTTNGYVFPTINIHFNGAGGGWTLGSALSLSGATGATTHANIRLIQGTLNTSTSNYSISARELMSTGSLTRALILNGSTVNVNTVNWSGSSSTFTFNAGTSTFAMTGTSFGGAGKTFNNVTFTSSVVRGIYFTDSNTVYNNITLPTWDATNFGRRVVAFSGTGQKVNGTLTLATNRPVYNRYWLTGSVGGSVNIAAISPASLSDIDFENFNLTGALAPLSGTRFGDAGGNNNIIFSAPKNVYWSSSSSSANYHTANVWALTSGGTPSANNYPLLQDTAILDDNSSTGIDIVFEGPSGSSFVYLPVGNFDTSSRTTPWRILTRGSNVIILPYGDIFIISSSFTDIFHTPVGSYEPRLLFIKQNTTQFLDLRGLDYNFENDISDITFAGLNSTINIGSNFRFAGQLSLAEGTLNLNSYTITCDRFADPNFQTAGTDYATQPRTLNMGTGGITVTGDDTGSLLTLNLGDDPTNISIINPRSISLTYNADTGTRTIIVPNFSESNAFNLNISNGIGPVVFKTIRSGAEAAFKNITINSSFTGTLSITDPVNCYGNFSIGTPSTAVSTNTIRFLATSGTKSIDFNGFTIANAIFGSDSTANTIFQLTTPLNATSNLILAGGTLILPEGTVTNVGAFSTTGNTQKILKSSETGTQATINDGTGVVSVSRLTIQDIEKTGAAVYYAPLGNLNRDNGNNSGWIFLAQSTGFIAFFN